MTVPGPAGHCEPRPDSGHGKDLPERTRIFGSHVPLFSKTPNPGVKKLLINGGLVTTKKTEAVRSDNNNNNMLPHQYLKKNRTYLPNLLP